MENVHSETTVRHFSTIFGFGMIVVSPNCKVGIKMVNILKSLFAVRTPHTVFTYVFMLLCYECTLMPLIRNLNTLNSATLLVSTSIGEHRRIYIQMLTLYMSAYF